MTEPKIMPGAEPFGFDGSTTGVLLVHGFTGSPQTLRLWGEYLAGRGYTVLCPRLPGHGTRPADLHGVTWRDWLGEAEMALTGLFERCQDVFIGTISMGGALTTELAARHGGRLSGLVMVNPFLYSTDPRVKLAPIVGRIPLLLKGVYNDIAEPGMKEVGYPKVSTKASLSVIELGKRAMKHLPKITVPTLVFTSRQDHVVHPSNSSYYIEHLGTADKEQVWLDRSYHVATLDYDREIIFERSAKWIEGHTSA